MQVSFELMKLTTTAFALSKAMSTVSFIIPVALNYGIYKEDLPGCDENPKIVADSNARNSRNRRAAPPTSSALWMIKTCGDFHNFIIFLCGKMNRYVTV